MASTLNQVKYDELQLISKTLGSESEVFQQLHSNTRRQMDALRSEWVGEAAKAFFHEQEGTLLPAVQRVSKALAEAQSVLNEIMKITHDADLETKSYFNGFGGENLISKLPGLLDAYNSLKGIAKLVAGGYLASTLTWSSLRPNSMIFNGPNWLRGLLDIKEMTRVIKPSTLAGKLAGPLINYLPNAIDGIVAGVNTFYNDPKYAGTDSARSAAIWDGGVKTAIGVLGTTAVIGATIFVGGISGPPLLIGGAVIGTWVAGGIIVDKIGQIPWNFWQHSDIRDQVIQSSNGSSQATKTAFDGFINDLMPMPVPAPTPSPM